MRTAPALLCLFLAACLYSEEAKTAATREALAPRNDVPGLKNYAKVSDTLHRGAQPTAEGFAELQKLGVKTIINLRAFNSDRDELKGLGLQYVHIYCKAWHPEDEDVAKFLQAVRDPKNQPVFVHCQHGSDRTGMMVAIYRMFEQGWSADEAAKELKPFGFHELWTEIAKYLRTLDKTTIERQMEKVKPAKMQVVK